jgi:hypothetical protein
MSDEYGLLYLYLYPLSSYLGTVYARISRTD